MTFTELFNHVAEDKAEVLRLLGLAVEKLNAPPKIADAALKKSLDDYTVVESATPGAATLKLDLEKLQQGAKTDDALPKRLGLIFDGLAERGNIFEGRRITLRADIAKPAEAKAAPQTAAPAAKPPG
jgi:hypothetical protein